jgi:hypothetical protein
MWRLRAWPMLILFLLPPAAAAEPKPASEEGRIEALIKHVEGLEGATFVRNGSPYDAKTAARFLRAKRDAKKDEIKTAAEFIEKVASTSSTSGKPYLIRFKDGRETKSSDYLKAQLKKLNE